MIHRIRRGLEQVVLLGRTMLHSFQRRMATPIEGNLDALAILYGTDKALTRHGYTPYYARHFQERRHRVKAMLEIGIGGNPYDDPHTGGSSVRMWRNYFPEATVYAMDIHEKHIDEPRIVVLRGDQSDPQSLLSAIAQCPTFDIIVDDGSHQAEHITTSFQTLFPLLADGGIYAIEDLETAYWPRKGGGAPGTPGTAMALIKELLDEVNIGPRHIAAVHGYPGVAFIEKAVEPAPFIATVETDEATETAR